VLSFLHNYFPYAGEVSAADDPPRKSWATLNAIVAQTQPSARQPGQNPYDQARRNLPPSITAVRVDDPIPWLLAASVALVAASWIATPPAPQQARRSVVPTLVAAPLADQPAAPSLGAILQNWRFKDPAPQQARKLSPQITAVPEDNPPFGLGRQAWPSIAPAWLAQPPRRVAAIAGVSADNPPFGARRQPSAAPPAWWPPQSAPRTQPQSVDDPPRESASALASIIAQWLPPPPWPKQATKLAPQLIAVAEDNPPFGVHATPPGAWFQQLPQPVVRLRFVVQAAVPADFVPFTRPAVWRASVDWPSQRRLLPASLIAVAEDNPPFGLKRQAFAQAAAWPAQASARIAPLIGVAADNPPFGRRASVWTAQATWPAQSSRRAVIPSTDNPPFGAKRQRYGDALPSWPTQPRRVLAPQSVDDPPVRLRAIWTILDAWRPAPPQPPVSGKLNAAALAVAVDDPPFASRRLREIPAYWLPPPTLWRQVKHAGTLRGTVFVGEPSGVWVAPSSEKWTAPLAGRVWKATTKEGWRK
jgi:hypothetical protein